MHIAWDISPSPTCMYVCVYISSHYINNDNTTTTTIIIINQSLNLFFLWGETLHLLPNGNALIMCIKKLIHIITWKLMNVNNTLIRYLGVYLVIQLYVLLALYELIQLCYGVLHHIYIYIFIHIYGEAHHNIIVSIHQLYQVHTGFKPHLKVSQFESHKSVVITNVTRLVYSLNTVYRLKLRPWKQNLRLRLNILKQMLHIWYELFPSLFSWNLNKNQYLQFPCILFTAQSIRAYLSVGNDRVWSFKCNINTTIQFWIHYKGFWKLKQTKAINFFKNEKCYTYLTNPVKFDV